MANPGFVSPGAMAGNAIERFLMQREEAERQRMLEEFTRQQAEQEAQRRASELELDRQRETRISADSDATREALQQEREFRRASTIAENAVPDDPTDAATADLLKRQGFGGQVRHETGSMPSRTLDMPVAPGIVMPGRDMGSRPESFAMRGGSKYLNARAAEEARAGQAEAERASREERAREANDTRAMIAGMSNQGRAETTNLRNDLLRTQVDAANQKATEKEEAKGRARNAARVRSQTTIDVLKELADFDPVTGKATLKPGTANLFGAQNPLARLKLGGETNNAAAALRRLTGTAVIDLINEMKNQSATGATGFGSLSGSEGKLLETSASELGSPLISDERAASELERMYRMAQQLYGTDTPEQSAGAGPPRVYYDANGRPVQR